MDSDEEKLRAVLSQFEPSVRNQLRRFLVEDDRTRDAIAQALLRHGTGSSVNLADAIDMFTINADARRMAVRILGELEARDE